ncbi:hypothetical protein Tco_1263859 [Tanacetum coccineum]
MKDKGDILLVQVYVDDIIFGYTKKYLCDEFEGLMSKRFQMSSMGELTFFLGLFQVTPKTSHLYAVKRIFRYLKGQPKLGLWYPKDSPFHLEAFSDSDYAGASLDRKSTTGDETVYKKWEDRIERAATTASSLDAEQDSGSGPRSKEPTVDKEKVLWVKLKRLFEPDDDDTLWKLQRYMHGPLK